MFQRFLRSCQIALSVAIIGFDQSFRLNHDCDYILGYTDELTGLPNLKAFQKEYRLIGKDKCLIIIDVDSFKKINDENGHSYGDLILKRLSEILNSAVKGKGKAFRLHGDEFAIIISDTSCDEICHKLMTSLREDDCISISYGVAFHNSENVNLLDLADQNMYENKKSKCQQFEFA